MTFQQRNLVAPTKNSGDDLEYGSWKYGKSNNPTVQYQANITRKKLVIQEKRQGDNKFDLAYKHLGSKCKPEEKRIDYVLVHPVVDLKTITDEEDKKSEERKNELREKFERAMKDEKLQKQTEVIGDKIYTKIHCPFRRLCEEAEAVSLELPLAGCESEHKEEKTWFNNWVNKNFVTDNEVDMVSAPFLMSRIHLYDKYDDPTNFFRPSVRSLLVEHILINIDLRYSSQTERFRRAAQEEKTLGNCYGCINRDNEELGDMQKVGLHYMMVDEVYTNKFILHDESAYNPDDDKKIRDALPKTPDVLAKDARLDMQLTWTRFFKFQPLWKIRNYFGETIGFYFAWSGTLVSTLWLPMLFGFAVFLYGLVLSIQKTFDGKTSSGSADTSNSTLTDLFANIRSSFDNDVTPWFALFLSVWGTLFLEVWKRKQAELAYQWDVEQFEENEPDRPSFYGTKTRIDPVTLEKDWYYPLMRRAWKLFLSSLSLLFMVCLVFVSVMGVIVYRVVVAVDYCPNIDPSACLVVTSLVSSLLNAISILILGKLYDMLARKLTEWENHRTETAYNDALIIKLFGFQFANNYTSCFYIAFFRGRFDQSGVFNIGANYRDVCEGSCMSQLSFQVLILMLTKPLPKFLSDVMIPWLKKQFKKRCQCCSCIPFLRSWLQEGTKPNSEKTLVEIESEKPPLGDFTLSEYTEKVIQYGLMMLFAASFPLAPLLALLTNLFDIRVDAWRMLWWYQRPIAVIAEDIGTWYVILTLMNFCGVISNAFLIAYTSAWGDAYDENGKLWIVIFFEHTVFLLKFLLAYMIPDTPASVALAMRKKRYQLSKKIEEDILKNKDLVEITEHEYSEQRKGHDMDYQRGGNYMDDNENDSDQTEVSERYQQNGIEQGPRYLAREDADGPWRRGQFQETEDETQLRRIRKKKKKHLKEEYEDVSQARDEMHTDYSGRTSSSIKIKDSRGRDLTQFEIPYS